MSIVMLVKFPCDTDLCMLTSHTHTHRVHYVDLSTCMTVVFVECSIRISLRLPMLGTAR